MPHQTIVRSLTIGALLSCLAVHPSWGQTTPADSATSVLPQGFTKATITPRAGGGFVIAGAGLGGGKLTSNKCADGVDTCVIQIKASAAPLTGDDDDDKGCVIRVAPSWILSKDTKALTWKLNGKQAKKGFKFTGNGIELDDSANFSAPPKIIDDTTVTATVKTSGSVTTVVSYTIFLAQNGHTCDGYDPIIVNRDN